MPPSPGPEHNADPASLDFLPTAPPPIAQEPPANPADPFDFSAAAKSPRPSSEAAANLNSKRKKPSPRQPLNGKILAAIGVGLLLLSGVGIWTYLQNLPVYKGSVAGVRVPSGQAIAVTVPWTTLDIPGGIQGQVIEYFKRHQTSLTNNLLKIDIGATPQGMTVRFATTEDSILVSVDPQLVPDIQTLISQNQAAWEEARKNELKQFAQELCTNVAKAQSSGTRVENVSSYRDTVALNALVHGLGRHCVVVANKTTHPCVFEDDKGLLYFVVPEQVQTIVVLEKSGEGRVKSLPADFQILASVPPAASTVPHLESTEPDDETESETEMDAAKPAESDLPPKAEGEMSPAAGESEVMPVGEKMTPS